MRERKSSSKEGSHQETPAPLTAELQKRPGALCEHGLPWLRYEGERLCALEYMNRFVAPNRVKKLERRGKRVFLAFDSGEKIECCCENCGESHGDDREFVLDIEELTGGRRALRFRLEPDGHLVVWFARGDNLHLHRNALERFRPPRRPRSVRAPHPPSDRTPAQQNKSSDNG